MRKLSQELLRFIKIVAIGLQAALEFIAMTLLNMCLKFSIVIYIMGAFMDALSRPGSQFVNYAWCIIALIMFFPISAFVMSFVCKKIASWIMI